MDKKQARIRALEVAILCLDGAADFDCPWITELENEQDRERLEDAICDLRYLLERKLIRATQ